MSKGVNSSKANLPVKRADTISIFLSGIIGDYKDVIQVLKRHIKLLCIIIYKIIIMIYQLKELTNLKGFRTKQELFFLLIKYMFISLAL